MIEVMLLVAGLVAGALNSLAGGGSFIAFPALLAAGVPPIVANASNTFAALPGYASGAFGYREDILRHRDKLVPYSLVAGLFGYLGAELLLVVSNEAFSQIVPWLMLVSVLLFAFGAQMNRVVASRAAGRRGAKLAGTVLLLALLAVLSLYGGFFNAGFGIMLLAFLAVAGFTDIHAMNGLKLWISTVVAIIATARFILSGAIDWYHGGLVLVGVVIGAYVAARIAHRIPTGVIRALVLIYASGLTAWFFYKAYFSA